MSIFRPRFIQPRRRVFIPSVGGAAQTGLAGVAVLNLVVPQVSAGSIGNRYIVGVGATGTWSGQDNDIAKIDSLSPTVWSFTTPKAGYTLYIDDENEHYKFNGSTWELI